jgi:predicted transcriptional regulator
LDECLLAQVDRLPLAREKGRSALIRVALEAYLARERRERIDEAYDRAYGGGGADEIGEEMEPLMRGQAWPEE